VLVVWAHGPCGVVSARVRPLRHESRVRLTAVKFDVIDCIGCGLPAEIVDRWTWPSTDGPVEHIATVCVNGCRYSYPTH
jgi:hypothetical protein